MVNQKRIDVILTDEEFKSLNIPDWVAHIRTDPDGRRVGFEYEPKLKRGYWQGGGRWVVLK